MGGKKQFPLHIVAAAGYIFDGNGNILLVNTYSRGWDVPGGQVENGETVMDGLHREIDEESGVTATVRGLVGVYSNIKGHPGYGDYDWVNTKVMLDFVCDYQGGDLRPSNENSETMWVPVEQAMSLVTAPAMRYRLQKALDFEGRVTYASYQTSPDFKLFSDTVI